MTDASSLLPPHFEPVDDGDKSARWKALAERALQGGDPDQALMRKTADGAARGPVFFQAPELDAGIEAKPSILPWGMRQTLVEADPQGANRAALDDLMGGVSELELRLDASGAHGLAARDSHAMQTALKDVDLSIAAISLDALDEQPAHAGVLMKVLNERGLSGARGGLGLAPIEQAARTGTALDEAAIGSEARMTLTLLDKHPDMTGFRADAALAYEAGGSEVQELGFMAACGAAYIRALIDEGASPAQAVRAVEARLAAGTDIHLTIAKLRAARLVWGRLAEAFGAPEEARALRLHAVTERRSMSAKDVWTNLIRAACAGFAAAAGGADAITVRPLTEALGRPSGFARRLARNLHILLAEESHVGAVADPAAGSYLHDSLSLSLAQAGWAVFQEIERRGGALAAVHSGWLAGEIAQARAARLDALKSGQAMLLGVTKYPDPDPRAVEIASPWPDAPAPGGDHPAIAPALLTAPFEAQSVSGEA